MGKHFKACSVKRCGFEKKNLSISRCIRYIYWCFVPFSLVYVPKARPDALAFVQKYHFAITSVWPYLLEKIQLITLSSSIINRLVNEHTHGGEIQYCCLQVQFKPTMNSYQLRGFKIVRKKALLASKNRSDVPHRYIWSQLSSLRSFYTHRLPIFSYICMLFVFPAWM